VFERALFDITEQGIARLSTPNGVGQYPALRRILSAPGRDDDEVDKLVTYFVGEGKPAVRHGYSRVGATMPCYAIILAAESTAENYLGDALGPAGEEAAEFVASVEKELGHPIEAAVDRFSFTYQVFVYAENPDVTLAYYNILRTIFIGAKRMLLESGMETPTFSGADLAPDLRYIPENTYVRQFTIQGFGHLLYSYDIDLGPFATGRGTKVSRIHVANNVVGVNPGVTPYAVEGEE
jgi:hypothetical protein